MARTKDMRQARAAIDSAATTAHLLSVSTHASLVSARVAATRAAVSASVLSTAAALRAARQVASEAECALAEAEAASHQAAASAVAATRAFLAAAAVEGAFPPAPPALGPIRRSPSALLRLRSRQYHDARRRRGISPSALQRRIDREDQLDWSRLREDTRRQSELEAQREQRQQQQEGRDADHLLERLRDPSESSVH